MQIECFSGFAKKPNSTKQPTGGTTINVTLKEPTSVLEPVFIIQNYDLSWNYIRWGNRYYYVDDIVIVHNNIAEYHCSSDPMAIYKSDIGSSSQYVLRSASQSDTNIIDMKYPTKTSPTGQYYTPTTISAAFNGGCFVLGVKNGAGDTGITYYKLSSSQMNSLTAYMFSDVWLDATEISTALQKMLNNPMDYIASCYWYPFNISTGVGRSIWFGYWDSGVNGELITESNRIVNVADTVSLANHPQITRGNYLNGSPFTRIMADIYGFGRVPIDPNLYMSSRSMTIRIITDVFTGLGDLVIESSIGRASKTSAMVGVPVQLSQVTQDLIKPAISMASTGASFATGHYIGAVAGIADAVTTLLSPQMQTSGSIGSKVGYAIDPRIYIEWYSIVDEDNATMGKPLCKVRTINALSGYIQCENADLDISASPQEKQRIIEYMNGGFYYE